jgi:hypothetical protein
LVSLLFTVAPISAFSALPFVTFVPHSNRRMMTTGSTELESGATVIATNADPDSNTATAMTTDQFHPYLEEIKSEASLNFAKSANDKCLAELGDPTSSSTYDRVPKC